MTKQQEGGAVSHEQQKATRGWDSKLSATESYERRWAGRPAEASGVAVSYLCTDLCPGPLVSSIRLGEVFGAGSLKTMEKNGKNILIIFT